jgi:hypothetical protein
MRHITAAIALSLLCLPAKAATLVVSWSITTDPIRTLEDRTSIPLSAGTPATGDGTLLQLGYYTMATTSDPFSGTWVTLATTTMGDDGVEIAGKFSTTNILGPEAFSAPDVGTPLAIRFFDSASVAGSSYYGAASNDSGTWNYVAPDDPAPVLDLVIDKGSGVVFERGPVGAFKTYIPVPEPAVALLFGAGLGMMVARRRRR